MTFSDKAVTIFLIAASLTAMAVQSFILPKTEGERVVITVDKNEYASYNFSDVDKEITLKINTEFGSNTVVIDKNSVRVTEADCPDKLDVKAGSINQTNQMIVCLPNRLMIEIKGGERKVDKVTY